MSSKEKTINIAKKGDIINQQGNFVTGVDKSSKTEIHNHQDLPQAAKDIKTLLDQLSLDYPRDSYRILGARAVDEVNKNPVKYRIIRGLKTGSLAALEKVIDHPAATFFIEATKSFWNERDHE